MWTVISPSQNQWRAEPIWPSPNDATNWSLSPAGCTRCSGPAVRYSNGEAQSWTSLHTLANPTGEGKGWLIKTYALCLAFFAFAVPVGAMIYAYYKIYCIARASKRAAARYGPQKEESPQGERVPLKESTATKHTNAAATADDNKALKTVLLLIGSFAACWSIYTLATVWRILTSNSVPPWIVRVGLVLTLCNCCIDPFIYSIRDEKMKREIKEMICKILCRNTWNHYPKRYLPKDIALFEDCGLQALENYLHLKPNLLRNYRVDHVKIVRAPFDFSFSSYNP